MPHIEEHKITGEKFWTGTKFLTNPEEISQFKQDNPEGFDPLAMQAPDQEPITPIEGVHFNPLFSPPTDPKITAESLKPVQPIDFQIPEETPIFPVADLTPPLEATPTETEATELSTRLRGLQEELIGQSAFRTEQEEERGLSVLEQTQQDLAGQLKI